MRGFGRVGREAPSIAGNGAVPAMAPPLRRAIGNEHCGDQLLRDRRDVAARFCLLCSDILTFVRSRLLNSPVDLAALLELYRKAWSGKPVADDEANPLVSVLKLSGIVRVVDGMLRVRNRIYARVFDRRWIVEQMPGAELRRQRRAFWRGVARTATISAVIIAAIGSLAAIAVREARRANRSERVAQRQAAVAEAGRQSLRRTLYAAQTNLAQQAWEAGNIGRAIRLLEAQRPAAGQEELRLRTIGAISGASARETACAPSAGTRTGSMASRSPPTGNPWRRPARTTRSGCGTSRPDRRSPGFQRVRMARTASPFRRTAGAWQR
jgi:hypothetical protein